MKTLILVTGFLFSMSAFADFNGTWAGTGHVKTPGFESDCSQMNISYAQASGVLNEKTYNYTCGPMGASFPQMTFQVNGQEVSYSGQKVGTITDTHLHLEFVDNQKTKQTIDLDQNGATMTDHEIYTDNTGATIMNFTGTLHKVSAQ